MINVLKCLALVLIASVICEEVAPPRFTRRPVPTEWKKGSQNIGSYPNPRSDGPGCNRPSPSWICDANKLLTVNEMDLIDNALSTYLNGTYKTCLCANDTCEYTGVPIVVTIMRSFESDGTEASLTETMKEYAEYFAKNWIISQCGDMIIVVISHGDPKVYIHWGEPVLLSITEDCRQQIDSSSKIQILDRGILGALDSMNTKYRKKCSTNKGLESYQQGNSATSRNEVRTFLWIFILMLTVSVL